MKLYSSASSPFGRKVKITAHLTGLFDQIEVVNIDGNDSKSTSAESKSTEKDTCTRTRFWTANC